MTEGLYKILINNCNTYLHKQTNFNLNYVIFSWPTSKLISSIKKMVIGSPTQPSSSCLFWIFVFCICVLRLAFRMPFFNLVVYPSILVYPFFLDFFLRKGWIYHSCHSHWFALTNQFSRSRFANIPPTRPAPPPVPNSIWYAVKFGVQSPSRENHRPNLKWRPNGFDNDISPFFTVEFSLS